MSFQKSVDDPRPCLDANRRTREEVGDGRQVLRIGDYEPRVEYALAALTEQNFSRRLWEKDPTLWRQGPEGAKTIKNRLGWLDVVPTMMERADEIVGFAEEVRNAGFTHTVLMGMGGSSLSPDVSRLTFGVRDNRPDMMVLDSTVPANVLGAERKIDLERTLFIVSTKSGTTVETLSAYRYFFDKVKAKMGSAAGQSFTAITDPGTPLEEEARNKGFRRVFLNFPDIGGRYSALSYFGLVPAAIIGVDIKRLLERASRMVERSQSCVAPKDNPGIVLGTVMGEMAAQGRDKLTLILSPEIASFGCWIEQLIAESTGKSGTGILPIEGEPIGSPNGYADDRLFVYLRLGTSKHEDLDRKVDTLEQAGLPLVRIRLDDVYDLGQEYFRWEVATAIASAILGVNAFDEPNVKESKDNTSRLLDEFNKNGAIPEEQPILEEAGIKLYCDTGVKETLDEIRAAGSYTGESLLSYLAAFLDGFQPGNYFALMAFTPTSRKIDGIFQCMRGHLRDAYLAATTLGYGPRFLHSTGQFHKGGTNTGIFMQFTCDDAEDAPIQSAPYTWSVLKQAQSMGDALSLRSKGRSLLRLHMGADVEAGLNYLLDTVHQAVSEQREIE